jgi:protein-disulfide isomerase
MRRYPPFIIVVSVGLLTLASATILYRAKSVALSTIETNKIDKIAPQREREEGEAKRPKQKMERAEPVHLRGNPDAPVMLEEFGDFQCPPCASLSDLIKQLQKEYGQRLGVIFSHFPLLAHAHAKEAAWAAEAAGMQDKFWEMHDLLYREQPVWNKAKDVRALFGSYAGILRLDIDRFKKDMESARAKARVEADQKRGTTLGVSSTPGLFINDSAVPPASLNPASLRADINKMMNEKPSP